MERHHKRKARYERRKEFDEAVRHQVDDIFALVKASDPSLPVHEQPIALLRLLLKEDSNMENALRASLVAALDRAQAGGLKVFAPTSPHPRYWPTTTQDYLDVYLPNFVRWVPAEASNDAQSQRVLYMLCHFYWLVQDIQGPPSGGDFPAFNYWLVLFADAWGSFLDTPESASGFESFITNEAYHVQDSMVNGRPNNPSGWLSFNQFFARDLNPGKRPVDSLHDSTVITAPADCTWKATYTISHDLHVKIKGPYDYTTAELLDGSQFTEFFAGGSFTHFFLGPGDYHHFGCPVDGVVLECRPIEGAVYLNVEIGPDGGYHAPDSSEDGFEFRQSRGLIVIENDLLGKVAILPIGMAQVSGVNMTATVGSTLSKGERFGYFTFGGSDLIVLFEKRAGASIYPLPIHRLIGERVGIARPQN